MHRHTHSTGNIDYREDLTSVVSKMREMNAQRSLPTSSNLHTTPSQDAYPLTHRSHFPPTLPPPIQPTYLSYQHHPPLPPSHQRQTQWVMSSPSVLTATLTSTVLYLWGSMHAQTHTHGTGNTIKKERNEEMSMSVMYCIKCPAPAPHPPSDGSVCPRRVDFWHLPQSHSSCLHQEVIDRNLILTTRHILCLM